MHVCLYTTTYHVAFAEEVAYMGLVRLGLSAVVNNRTMCVWTIHGGCEPGDVVKSVTFMPCHFNTSISSFRMLGHMLCYLISTLITDDAGVGFYFQEFDGECHIVADRRKRRFDNSL